MEDDTLTAASSPVPQVAIVPTPAPGLQGPRGLSPRQNYSRVNTGVPEGSDAGALQQKSIMPKVGSVMSISMATRPRALNDMLKTAMQSALGRAKVAEEAKRQLANLEGEDEEESKKEDKKKEKDSCMKTSSAYLLPTDYALKLAAASDYIVELLKVGADLAGPYTLTENITGAGLGPQALKVTPTEPWGPDHVLRGSTGQAVNKIPLNPSVQKAQPQEHGATQLENDIDRAPGTGDAPVSGSTKNAAPVYLLRKMAAGELTPDDLAAAADEVPHPGLIQRAGNFVGRHLPAVSAVQGGLSGGALGGGAGLTLGYLLSENPRAPLIGAGLGALGGAAIGAPLGWGAGRFMQGVAQGAAGGAVPYPNQEADPGLVPAKTAGATTSLLRKMAAELTPEDIAAAQAAGTGFVDRNLPTIGSVAGATIGAPIGAIFTGAAGETLADRLIPEKYPRLRALGGPVGMALGAGSGAVLGALGGRYLGSAQQAALQNEAGKMASAPIHLLRKMAEDAINPAQVSAGSAESTRLPTSVTGEAGPPASGKGRVPASAAGVAGFTRREAKSVPKAEMGKVLDEPMDSPAHDNVLQQAFSHTEDAGAKISSAQNVKLAAARALLQNLANGGK